MELVSGSKDEMLIPPVRDSMTPSSHLCHAELVSASRLYNICP
jgi:hypothetical protein